MAPLRRIPGTIGLALGLLVAGCGGTGTPEPPASLATGTATTASAVEPPAGSTAPSSAARSAASASRTAGSSSSAAGAEVDARADDGQAAGEGVARALRAHRDHRHVVRRARAGDGGAADGRMRGTLCVTMLVQVEGPPDPDQDCTVKRIIQSVPIYRGDTITFVLSDPCGDFTEPSPAG
ncbi:hypothetical protein PV458_15800 [Streptomyces sp. MN03-5084-2B]|nr:hypothetical protein [Streptomyces sp. MN03-5084-2B]